MSRLAVPDAAPSPLQKLLRFHWALALTVMAVAAAGVLMLYSVAGGSAEPWAARHATRFGVGFALMLAVAFVHIRWWRALSPLAWLGALALLLAVEIAGATGMGATRWIDLGPIQLQPSELMKIGVVMALAFYYDRLDPAKVSRPLWLLPPLALVLKQPDLGTALLIGLGGAAVMWLAGVHWGYFAAAFAAGGALVTAVLQSRGTSWQLIKDYQFRRIDVFLNPELDPLGAGYHITQSKIAFGSGGLGGRGYMQGTQSRLNFLPEKHTDFIFTTLAEEFGFFGTIGLLTLYGLIVLFCLVSMLANRDRFGALLTGGLAVAFFLFFAVNMAMVTGLAPVVGVPLPLVSYGGSALLVLMLAFGLVQSAHIHRPR